MKTVGYTNFTPKKRGVCIKKWRHSGHTYQKRGKPWTDEISADSRNSTELELQVSVTESEKRLNFRCFGVALSL